MAALKQSSSTSFLFAPLRGSVTPPNSNSHVITPTTNCYQPLMAFKPETKREEMLLNALREAQKQENGYKEVLDNLQASMVLQRVYVLQAQEQIQSQGKPKPKKKKKLFGDGMPRLVSGDQFHKDAMEIEEEAQNKEEQASVRRLMRAEKQTEKEELKRLNVERVEQNNQRQQVYQEEIAVWKEEQKLAKIEQGKPWWTKSKLTGIEGRITQVAIEKPASVDATMREEKEEEDDNDNNGNEFDKEDDGGDNEDILDPDDDD
ncbi:hypothetical protein CVT24_011604 [Panaeolus cyanescens]|uniref:Uncharacterized protein n=1 Tax=Panaeolus cyanescens TaxID=181874 RepID=A0A409X9P5_9AGAR|nr:hypothetical protein CVT24_011604 [Panaeolus cyanescens]